MKTRLGTGLVELMVSLALGGVLAAAATRGLVQHLRIQRDRDAQSHAQSIVRDVHEVLRAELAHAMPNALLLGDTAIQLASVRLFARACQQDAFRIVIPATELWWSAARAGDSVAIMDTLMRTEWRGTIAVVGSVRASASCPVGGTRLTFGSPLPSTVPALAVPVRVWSGVRLVTYRASDRTWWLGERSCTPACGAVQPIAGPLLAPSQAGFRVLAVRDQRGRLSAVDVLSRAVVGGHEIRRSARFALGSPP